MYTLSLKVVMEVKWHNICENALKTLKSFVCFLEYSFSPFLNKSCSSFRGFSWPSFFFFFLGSASAAHGGSQSRGRIWAVAAGLCQSYSNTRSKPWIQPTPQFTTTPDPEPTEWGRGSNPHPHGSWWGLLPLCHGSNSLTLFLISSLLWTSRALHGKNWPVCHPLPPSLPACCPKRSLHVLSHLHPLLVPVPERH